MSYPVKPDSASSSTIIRQRVADLRGRGIYSDYADRHRCIFIHVPKTAGTGIARALFGRPSRHLPWAEYQRANPRKFRRYFKFAFVRNPWDRLVSTFFFLKAGGINAMDRAWAQEHLAQYGDFDAFVNDWLTEENIWSWVHFKPQHHFICDERLTVRMDFVGRFERLQEDFRQVAERLGIQAKLGRVNSSRRGNYRDYYSIRTAERVGEVYAEDIRLFGYSR